MELRQPRKLQGMSTSNIYCLRRWFLTILKPGGFCVFYILQAKGNHGSNGKAVGSSGIKAPLDVCKHLDVKDVWLIGSSPSHKV